MGRLSLCVALRSSEGLIDRTTSKEATMGREKEAQILNEESARRRQRAERDICYICGQPATASDPKGGGRLCGYHLQAMEKED